MLSYNLEMYLGDSLIRVNIVHVVLNEGQDSSFDVECLVGLWIRHAEFFNVTVLVGHCQWVILKVGDQEGCHWLHGGCLWIVFRESDVTHL